MPCGRSTKGAGWNQGRPECRTGERRYSERSADTDGRRPRHMPIWAHNLRVLATAGVPREPTIPFLSAGKTSSSQAARAYVMCIRPIILQE